MSIAVNIGSAGVMKERFIVDQSFLKTTEQKEVRAEVKRRTIPLFVSTLGVAIASPLVAHAEEGTEATEQLFDLTPNSVMELGINLSLITVAVGVALSGSLLAIAGIYRMFRKRREAQIWTVDIVKGLVQVLIAVPIVYTLFYLSQLIFGNLSVLDGLL